MSYRAPVDDIMFALKTATGLADDLSGGLYGDLDEDTIRSVIEEAGRFGEDVLAPLNWTGDQHGSQAKNGIVTTPPGWAEAYRQFADGGWSALPCPEEFGGQGLPTVVGMAVCEIWNGANTSFGLCPLLTQGAIDAIEAGASPELKARFLPAMVAGRWTGTMNLTEPHAGSDLSTLKAKAIPQGDGTYLISGTKIFITYGEHEMAENIIHLVLARLPDAPEGTRGISLFIVPKFMVTDDGVIGARNDVICAGVEHKLGIKASPTCTMKFGENGGATGYLVGEPNRGLATMFVMMNAARLAVGLQGVGVAEAATQRAAAFAAERRQGRSLSARHGHSAPIIEHPDVRRSLMTMRSLTQAARAICLVTAREMDMAHRAATAEAKHLGAVRAALLTPIAKAFATDIANEVASLGVQVHGGMGFVEETGAAQHLRDARILPIYEGTNGIQAIDLVTRKLPLDGGAVAAAFIKDLAHIAGEVRASNRPEFGRMGERLAETVSALAEATRWMGVAMEKSAEAALAGATPYLRLFALAAGGAYLAKGALQAARDGDLSSSAVANARFFAENIATAAPGLTASITSGAESVLIVPPGKLAS